MSLRQKFGKALFNGNATTLASRAAPGQGAVVSYTQQRNYRLYNGFVDNDLTGKWLHRLRLTANTHEGRDKLGQISSIIEYFNKPTHNTGL
jgi:hypothetical protein